MNYKKDAMRSTMFPLGKEFQRLGISGLIKEMADTIYGPAPAQSLEAVAAKGDN